MKFKLFLFSFTFFSFIQTNYAQVNYTLTILDSGHRVSLRGLSAINNQVFWVSGSSGTVFRSEDGGKTLEKLTVKGFEKRDFRDIDALDARHAYIMAVDSPGLILKTSDGGKSWKTIFTDTSKGVFLDAFAFNQDGAAVVVGDPLQNKLAYMLLKKKDDDHFQKSMNSPVLETGEAFFAASGTNVQYVPGTRDYVLVSGGMVSRFFNKNEITKLPLLQGAETTGANSIAVWDKDNMYVVGGDFLHDKDITGNACYTKDGGKTWLYPETPPFGYRSCVMYLKENILLTCGTSGVDISTDGGIHWKNISTLGFHVCQLSKDGKVVFLAGQGGRIARLTLE